MRPRSVAVWAAVATALTFGVAACGDDNNDSGSGSGSTGSKNLTIYSSLPLQGDSRPQSESVVNGEKLALEQVGGKVGDYTIKYVSLDDATAAAGKWEPGAVSSNARKAVAGQLDDRRTSVSSTPAPRRSRSRSSTRPGSCRSRRPTRPSA